MTFASPASTCSNLSESGHHGNAVNATRLTASSIAFKKKLPTKNEA